MKPSVWALPVFLFLIPLPSWGQNKFIPPDPYTSWDGTTHKSRYMIFSPGFMGPNALPVPYVHKARVPETVVFDLRYDHILGSGNTTQSMVTRLAIPFAKKRIAIELEYNPIEFYTMDSATSRLWRTSTGQAIKGSSLGEFSFGTVIQLIEDVNHLPDMSISMNCRTASGKGRENSRHTNSPGYYMDFSLGDTYRISPRFLQSVRWYATAGFLAWQTNLDDYPQDDALLYGLGFDLTLKGFYLNQTLRGYYGYMNNGDRPVVYRVDLGINLVKSSVVFSYEKGIRDYPFQSFQAGICIIPVR